MFGALGGGQGQPKMEEKNPLVFENLLPYIDKTSLEALNVNPDFPVESALLD